MGVQFAGNILVQSNGGPLPISQGGTGQTTAPTAISALLPSQTGNSGKVLTTNGTTVSWTNGGAGTPGGSDTNIQYNDSGTFGGSSFLTVNKSTGAITSTSTLTNQGLTINKATSTIRQINFQTAGADRWLMGADGTAETGSNAGSNWFFTRIADNGTTQNSVFTVSRATGAVDFKVQPTLNGGSIVSTFTNLTVNNTISTPATSGVSSNTGIDLLLTGGSSSATGASQTSTAGNVVIAGGAASSNSNTTKQGDAILQGGDYSGSLTAQGGNAIVRGGNTNSISGTSAGSVVIAGGQAFSHTNNSGTVSLQTQGTNRLVIGIGGDWSLPASGTAVGTTGQVLTSQGAGVPPQWTSFTASAGTLSNATILGTVADSAISITGIANSTGAAAPMTISPGSTPTSTTGNSLTVQGGPTQGAGSVGGNLNLNGGPSGTSTANNGNGGNVNITGGLGGSNAGDVNINGGFSHNGNGGSINLVTGLGGNGAGGSVLIQAASLNSLTSGNISMVTGPNNSAGVERFAISKAGAVTFTGGVVGTNGQVLTSNGSGVPSWQPAAGGTFTGGTITGATTFTSAAPQISLGNATSNWISWLGGSAGIGAPTFTTRSVGSKLVLFPNITSALTDFAIGIESGNLWQSTANATTASGFKWYGGTTQLWQLLGDGSLSMTGANTSFTGDFSNSANTKRLVVQSNTGSATVLSANSPTSTAGTSFLVAFSRNTANLANSPYINMVSDEANSTALGAANFIDAGTAGTGAVLPFVIRTAPATATPSVERMRFLANGGITFNGAAAGTTGQVLTAVTNGAPVWQTSSGGSVAGTALTGTQIASGINQWLNAQLVVGTTATSTITTVINTSAGTFSIAPGQVSTGSTVGSVMSIAGGQGQGTGGGTGAGGALNLSGGAIGSGSSTGGGAVNITGGTGFSAGGAVNISGGTGPGGAGGALVFSTAPTSTVTERFRILANGAWSVGATGSDTGTSGFVLTSTGATTAPTWQAVSGSSGVASFNTRTGAVTLTNSDVTTALTFTPVSAAGSTMTGPLILSGDPVTGLGAATKNYVDSAVAGLEWKAAVAAATIANITLSGAQTIDGVALVAGQRILVKNQTTTTGNGIYVVATGAWTRSTDAASTANLDNATVYVTGGSTQSNTGWTQTTVNPVVGTDPIVFVQFNGSSAYAAGSNLTLTGNTFALNNTVTGLTSVAATTFTGALVGNASTATSATTGTNIAGGAANSIPYQTASDTTAFLAQGTGVLQETAGAPVWTTVPTLTGTNFSSIPNSALLSNTIQIGSTVITLGTGASVLAGLTSVTATTFTGALVGNASTATSATSATTATTATTATNVAATGITGTTMATNVVTASIGNLLNDNITFGTTASGTVTVLGSADGLFNTKDMIIRPGQSGAVTNATGNSLTLQASNAVGGDPSSGGTISLTPGSNAHSGATAATAIFQGNQALAGGNATITAGKGVGAGLGGNVVIASGLQSVTNGGIGGSITFQTAPTNNGVLTERLSILATGAFAVNTLTGTSGQVLTSAGANAVPTWTTPAAGSVSSVSVTTANGVSGTVATATSTPAITLTLGAITPTSVTPSGNIVFSGSGQRIVIPGGGSSTDLAFQAAGNTNTFINAIPGGTNPQSGLNLWNLASTTNAGLLQLYVNAAASVITTTRSGTGTYLPMAILTSDTERLRILANGAWSVGTTGTATGNSGDVLTSAGSGLPPTWTAATIGTTGTTLTLSGVATATVPTMFLSSASSAMIAFSNGTASPPITASRSLGTKIVLFPEPAGTMEFAIGIDNSTMWHSIPVSSFYKWYGGTNAVTAMQLTSAGALTVAATVQAPTSVTSQLHVADGAAATFRQNQWTTNGSLRWQLYADNTAEGGANAGSNFSLVAVNDAGSTPVATVFTVTRSTGVLDFKVAPTINGVAIATGAPSALANATTLGTVTNTATSITGIAGTSPGTMTIQGSASNAATVSGGNTTVKGGTGNTTGTGGTVSILPGDGGTTGVQGAVIVGQLNVPSNTATGTSIITVASGALSGGTPVGTTGNVTIGTGTATGGTAGGTGTLALTTGNGWIAGGIQITAGSSTNNTTNGSGSIALTAGANSGGVNIGGNITMAAGAANGNAGGIVSLTGGTSSSTAAVAGGAVTLIGGSQTGATGAGAGGAVNIRGGTSVSGAGGAIVFQTAVTTTQTTRLTITSAGSVDIGSRITGNATTVAATTTTTALDLSTANDITVSLSIATTAITLSSPPVTGRSYTVTLYLTQDATGGRTVTWPASVKWSGNAPPVLTVTGAKVDIVTLTTVTGGTTYYGSVVGLNF